jgi:microcompartment protein CcmK/EutM
MKIARTIGTVTLSRFHPAMTASKLRLVEVVDDIDRLERQPLGGDSIVAWDLCGSGIGDLVALAEGPESAQPFRPETKPLDASIVAILDEVDLNS